MKNKDKKCCSKMSGVNIFIGALIGLTLLVFGGKMILSQTNIPTPSFLNTEKLDETLDTVKKVEMDFSGTWTTEGEDATTLTLNEDGTVTGMEGVVSWDSDNDSVTLMKEDGATETLDLTDGNLVSGEMVYKK